MKRDLTDVQATFMAVVLVLALAWTIAGICVQVARDRACVLMHASMPTPAHATIARDMAPHATAHATTHATTSSQCPDDDDDDDDDY